MRGHSSLLHAIATLKDLGGYFVFADDEGQEYVLTSKRTFDLGRENPAETQLELPPAQHNLSAATTAYDVLERVNRDIEKMNQDIALFQAQLEDTNTDDLAVEANPEPPRDPSLPPPRRVRFEPIRGDLPPELQE